ncbi:hypothetical protein [Gloeobacter morelensis]|uniref:TonB C-terminal domain-containing protein n=1 Tax=Gloeobacter morelensis MG652769 TaxID=2781736 RepID=A0ABY3PQJ1_9CYAN|nr:hypothetical protein [Gloeobacter morelensis]UFP95957.1 hypothetical protein ISF26_06990 [Gloeobacter morelensis MG652769]
MSGISRGYICISTCPWVVQPSRCSEGRQAVAAPPLRAGDWEALIRARYPLLGKRNPVHFTLDPPGVAGVDRLEVRFVVDSTGALRVTVRDLSIGRPTEISAPAASPGRNPL